MKQYYALSGQPWKNDWTIFCAYKPCNAGEGQIVADGLSEEEMEGALKILDWEPRR